MRPFGESNPEVDARRMRVLLPQFVPLRTALTAVAWEGGTYSTTAKTLIDLSSVFSVPANVKAILAYVGARDSGSAGTDCYIILGPTDTADAGMAFSAGTINSRWARYGGTIVPCDANGDIYYQIGASGAGTFTATLRIHGYWL